MTAYPLEKACPREALLLAFTVRSAGIMSKTDRALSHLWELVKSGKEFPDAFSAACYRFNLSKAEEHKLKQKYDAN
jgi:hypothetical protein